MLLDKYLAATSYASLLVLLMKVQRTHLTAVYLMSFQSNSILTLGCHSTTAMLPLQHIFAHKRAKIKPFNMQKS